MYGVPVFQGHPFCSTSVGCAAAAIQTHWPTTQVKVQGALRYLGARCWLRDQIFAEAAVVIVQEGSYQSQGEHRGQRPNSVTEALQRGSDIIAGSCCCSIAARSVTPRTRSEAMPNVCDREKANQHVCSRLVAFTQFCGWHTTRGGHDRLGPICEALPAWLSPCVRVVGLCAVRQASH